MLSNLGASEDPDALQFLAQAVWLSLRVHVPLDGAVGTLAGFVSKVGPAAEAAPWAAAYALFLVNTRGEKHGEREKLGKLALGMLGACAEAREVPEDKFMEWFEGEKLNDPNHFIPALAAAIETIVPADAWLFDRGLVGG